MTPADLTAATGTPAARAAIWAPALTATMQDWGITTPQRQAIFLAMTAEETGLYYWTEEIWNVLSPTRSQMGYEGRVDLGNTMRGDGYRFRGRGAPMLTGRAAYQAATDEMRVDFMTDPDLMAKLPYASDVAGWFWRWKGIEPSADAGNVQLATRLWNGGENGYVVRLGLFNRALPLLVAAASDTSA